MVYKTDDPCIACHRYSEGGTTLHHVKSQGSGGSDESFNLMPLCNAHHVLVHLKGLREFSCMSLRVNGVDGKSVTQWLKDNGWYIDNFLKKWMNERNFKNGCKQEL